MKLPTIQCTTDYDSFQCLKRNRDLNQKHIEELKNDPTFPQKFPFCPIVVNKKGEIIDGQHRFYAAQGKGIPIYYIVDPTAHEEDVRTRNMQMRSWKGTDYIKFYADKKPSYAFIADMLEKHKINLSFIQAVILKLGNCRQLEMGYKLKDGTLNIEKYSQDISTFLDAYVPVVKQCRTMKGALATKTLFMQAYIIAFAHFYKEDPKLFKRALTKVLICNIPLAYTTKYEEARVYVTRIANWHSGNTK